jgi:hypothetical protein
MFAITGVTAATHGGTKNRSQNPESRSQKKRKSEERGFSLSFWLLDSDSWILL